MSLATLGAALAGHAAPLFQQFQPGTGAEKEAGTDLFFDVLIWVIVLVPIAIAVAMAAGRHKRKPELPHATDLTWQIDVVESERPVLVHCYAAWSIGDRVIEKQVERIRELHGDRFRVLWLDVDKNPGVVALYPTLEPRSVALFVGGRLAWQGEGVHEQGDIVREVDDVLARAGRRALESA